MGQFVVRAQSGRAEDAARALESLVPVDIVGLAQGRQRYALFTNEQGGIRDDLMIANLGDRYLIVVNAACKDADEALSASGTWRERCDIERLDDRALLALQGPAAEAVLARVRSRRDRHALHGHARGDGSTVQTASISRSGYTGEDGFEISVPAATVPKAWRASCLADARVAMIGLGARDSLRLEAGLCLYG